MRKLRLMQKLGLSLIQSNVKADSEFNCHAEAQGEMEIEVVFRLRSELRRSSDFCLRVKPRLRLTVMRMCREIETQGDVVNNAEAPALF